MVDHVAVFKRAAPGAEKHSYKWMYSTCRAVLSNERREQVSTERLSAHASGAAEPATSGLDNKTNKNGNNKKNVACTTLLKTGKYEKKDCPCNHKNKVIAAAAADKGK